jgi:preprotein translocase subunit SecB
MNYKLIGKYIKKINFEINNPKIFFLLAKNISNYKINIDIKSKQFKEKIIEVETTLSLLPKKKDFEKINVEIIFSAIIEVDSKIDDKKKLEEVILIKVPSQVYPEIRKIFIFLFEESGFKEIKIDKTVDFQKLYDIRKIQ